MRPQGDNLSAWKTYHALIRLARTGSASAIAPTPNFSQTPGTFFDFVNATRM
jgi:hypothetical protein